MLVLGFRTKSPLVLGPVIWFSRAYMNCVQLRSAGTPGAYASIVRHRGRRTGRDYATPVTAVADGEAFLIALPYGQRANWLRNVLAGGQATLVTQGETWTVGEPEIVPLATVEDRFSPSDRRSHRLFGVPTCSASAGSSRRLRPQNVLSTDAGATEEAGSTARAVAA